LRQQAEPETVRILGLRVDFSRDGAGEESTGDGRFDLRPSDEAMVAVDPPPHDKHYFASHLEALRRYYDVQTSGGLVLEYDLYPADPDSAYHLPDTRRYGPWIFSVSSDSILTRASRFVRESLIVADRTDPTIDWTRYQSFLVFHAGGDFQSDINRDTPFDIPSFNLFLDDSLQVVVGGPDSVVVNLVMVVPETVSQDEFTGALNGVMAHEFGHQLGFFDLYDVFTGLPVVGVYSLMDSGDGQFGLIADPYHEGEVVAARGLLPASIDPWHRLLFFPQNVEIHQPQDGDVVSLPAVLERNDLLYLPMHLSEYLLGETRLIDYNEDDQVVLRADSTTGVVLGPEGAEDAPGDTLGRLEYDFLLPGEGMILWHVDELAITTGLASPFGSVNVFGDRRGVDIEEADGIQDIGTASPEFLGGPYDPFFEGGFTLYGPATVPDSRTNDGTATGIALTVLDPPGLTMRVRIGDPLAVAGWPIGLEGSAVEDPLNRADLNGDGFDEVLLAAGPRIFALTSQGRGFDELGEQIVLGSFADTLARGPAVAVENTAFEGVSPVVGAAAGGRAFWLSATGGLLAQWPGQGDPERVTAGPIPGRDFWIAGTSGGRMVGLRGGSGGAMDEPWALAPSGLDTLVCLLAGRVGPEGADWVAAGDARGRVFAAEAVGGEAPALLAGWPQPVGSGPVLGLLGFRAPLRRGGPIEDLLLVGTADGIVDLRLLRGAGSLPGWARTVGDELAGSPIVGDPDGDGNLEVIASTKDGTIHTWDLAGSSEPGWPNSVWHPDQTRRAPCLSAPVLWDLGDDGSIELLQFRGDGLLVALDSEGKMVPGWPRATGATGRGGPLRLVAEDFSERWFLTTALSDSVLALSAVAFEPPLAVKEDGPGCFPAPGTGAGRGGVLPSTLVPSPEEASAFLDERELILHPNPVRAADLKIRYVLGQDARVTAELFDVSGRARAQESWDAHEGAAGETHSWDLADLAPGYYVVRLQIDGEEERRTLFRSIAVVR
jgi:M6 family metalloprotease-like protein